MGFQHMKKPLHEAASRKGGAWKLRKGLGAMDPEKARAIQSQGGYAKANKDSGGDVKAKEDTGGNEHLLERVLDALDES